MTTIYGHIHHAEAEDQDECVECGYLFCLGCGVTIAYDYLYERYLHPRDLCHHAELRGMKPTDELAIRNLSKTQDRRSYKGE